MNPLPSVCEHVSAVTVSDMTVLSLFSALDLPDRQRMSTCPTR